MFAWWNEPKVVSAVSLPAPSTSLRVGSVAGATKTGHPRGLFVERKDRFWGFLSAVA